MLKTAVRNFLPGALFLVPAVSLGSGQNLDKQVHLDLGPGSLSTELVPAGPNSVKEARVKAGLDLSLGQRALDLDLDYNLLGKSADEKADTVLTQHLKMRLNSQLLNSLLGMNLGLDTDSQFREGGDAYRHSVRPGLSHRVPGIAQLKLHYEYAIDKQSRLAPELASSGYALVLDGAFHQGKLTWRGKFSSQQRYDQNNIRTREMETVDLMSRYQLARSLHVEFSGARRNESFVAQPGREPVTQTRYGAALGWSPSERYVLGLKVNTLEQTTQPSPGVLGSGSITWYPRPDLELKLDYGDQLVEGQAGWVLHTRLDLSG